MRTIDYIIIILYLLGLIAISFYTKINAKSVDEFLVSKKSLSVFDLTGTITASLIGAGMVMGVVGNVGKYGSGILWNYYGFAAGLVIFGRFFVSPIRKTKAKSMSEMISGKFGRLPRFICSIFIAVYAFSVMIIGITGMARLITYCLDMPDLIVPATIVSIVIAIAITAFGGINSVIWSDAIQFIIMVLMIVIITPIIGIIKSGSISEINKTLAIYGGTLDNPTLNVPVSFILTSFITLMVSGPGDPTVPQRALSGDNEKKVKKAFYLSAVMAVLFGYALTIVGGAALKLIPNISQEYGTTEAVLPLFIIKYCPPVLAGLGVAALVATIITTVTSMLLVGTTHIIYDAGLSLFPNLNIEKIKKRLPMFIILFGCATTWLSLFVESIGNVVYFAFSICGVFLFPMFAILYWPKVTKWGISLGVLFGASSVIVLYLLGISGPGGDPSYTGMFLSLTFTFLGSIVENRIRKVISK